MKLSEDIKQRIRDILDSEEFRITLYDGLDEGTRKDLGQFYTPAAVCISMIESYDMESFSGLTVLDPTCGSGNLLIAMLIAGADSDKIYGNEYDSRAVALCRKRINRACDILGKSHIKDFQIHQGNALQSRCLTEFSEEYDANYRPEYIDDLNYAQGKDKYGREISWSKENSLAYNRHNSIVSTKLF